MPRNPTTGVFTRVDNSFSEPVTGTLIEPADADEFFDDLTVGLNSIPKLTGDVTTTGGTLATTLATAQPGAHTWANTQTIAPPAASLVQGLVIEQNTPSTGSTAGPYFANTITGTWTSTLTGGGGPGGPRTMHQLNVQLYTGGPNYDTQSSGAISGVVHHVLDDTSVGDMVGIGGFVNSTANRSAGNIYGGTTGFRVDTGGSVPLAAGFEVDTFIEGTGVVFYRLGINSWTGGTKNANTLDSAYSIGASGAVGTVGWKKGLTLFTQNGSTVAPLADDADLIYADYTGTIANIFNLSTITVTDSIIKSPNVTLTGAGVLQLGRGASPTSDGGLVIAGGVGANLNTTLQYGPNSKWAYGATAGQFYIGAVSGPAAYALTIDNATNLVGAPSGLSVANGLTATGTITLGGFTFSHAGNTSLPAIVQGDLWYGSAAGTISALAKDAGASRFLKNSGTSNNPAWAQPAFTDISGSVAASQMPALTGEATTSAGAVAVTLTNSAVIGKVLTGYTSGAGTVSATDTILQAIQKLNGNDATNANLTGDVTSVGNATTLTNAPVIAKVLTGYTSGAGTVSASDSILQAIQKLNGNDATNANLTGDVTSVGNATTLTNAPVIAKVLTGYVASAGTVASTDSILQALQKLGGLVDNAAWTPYTPVASSSGGSSPTFANLVGAYKASGKTVVFTAQFQQTSASGSGALQCTLPFTAGAFNYVVNAVDGTASLLLQAQIGAGASIVTIKTATGTYPGANGDFFTITGTYERA